MEMTLEHDEDTRRIDAIMAQSPPRRSRSRLALTITLFSAVIGAVISLSATSAGPSRISRGAYLTTISGCGDCHTPGYFFGKPDESKPLSGSEVGFEIPDLGVFHGPNLTPDKETGLGRWSENEIVAAIRTGLRPDGRELAPIMPWRNFALMSDEDARSIAAFLKSLKPVSNKVPGPFGAQERSTSFVMRIVPPGG
jgi:mono/diheme cytochrome c family protein